MLIHIESVKAEVKAVPFRLQFASLFRMNKASSMISNFKLVFASFDCAELSTQSCSSVDGGNLVKGIDTGARA